MNGANSIIDIGTGLPATRRTVVTGLAKIAAGGALALAGGAAQSRLAFAQDATPEPTSDQNEGGGIGNGNSGGGGGNGGGGGRRNRDAELPAVGVGAAATDRTTPGLLGLGAVGALAAAFVAHRLTGARRQLDA